MPQTRPASAPPRENGIGKEIVISKTNKGVFDYDVISATKRLSQPYAWLGL